MRRLAFAALALAAGCAAAPQDIRSMITPEAIAASTEPLLFVELTETGQQAIMSLKGRNGDVVTWSTADGRTVSLQDGILVATRGFGFDLMSADISGTIAALNGGPQNYDRFVTHLDGENRTIIESFSCEMSGPIPETINSFGRNLIVSLWIESCRGLDEEVEMHSWRTDDMTWRTIQPVSEQLGAILTERLTGD